jgi:hypothetical protein
MKKVSMYDLLTNINEFLDSRELQMENIRLYIKREIFIIKKMRSTLESFDEKSGTFTNKLGFYGHTMEPYNAFEMSAIGIARHNKIE